MRIHIKYYLFSLIAVAFFLIARHWVDRKREQVQDIDIVRPDMYEGDAHLGTWAQKNGDTLITFRLKREGDFTYETTEGPSKKTVQYTGKYEILPAVIGKDGLSYFRLVALSDRGDTVINHFIETSHATKRDVDILSLTAYSSRDSAAMIFYRIKQ
ncbi:hypothetical protein [Ferruginibacter sp.]